MATTLDEHKICLITAVSDWDKYNESLATWQNLSIPEGMRVDVLTVEDWPSIGEAYQRAMNQSDAKYKVYVREDVWITRHDFLELAIKELMAHPEYGIASVVGSINFPESGHWWEKDMIGRICDNHEGKVLQYIYGQSHEDSLPATVLHDGLLVTQYDIPWISEFYDKGHLYAASQCMGFRKQG